VSRADVDAVCICTPSGAHEAVALAAAAAGKHLMIEKPLEIALDRIDRIIAAADAAGVKLGCVLPSRFMHGVEATKAALDGGRLGKLTLASASIPWFRSQEYYDGSAWRGTWELDGGGALMNQGIHTIDLLQWLVGPATSVYGQTTTLSHAIETEDTAAAILSLESGGIGTIRAGTGCYPGEPAKVELYGDRGTVVLEEGKVTVWKLADASSDEEARMSGQDATPGSGASDPMGITADRHRALLADLIAAIHEDREPAVSGAEARKSVELIRAIYASAKCGCPVSLPLVEDGGGTS
ncbi:MAG TPA: Gfo/Idh/MocA family oxidoreductase, partial [Thermomicrobiales bacterium]|nr:Gfo/Idh/MocA family oxidoreductase [Thermomicrobiales bacterium]